jgi:hypothetical protein
MEKVRHPSGPVAAVLKGFLIADDGTLIEASSNREITEPGFDTDCHGVSFSDGKYWINNDQVDSILTGDKYKQVGGPKVGDVAVYRDEDGNAVHSAKVVGIKREHSFLGMQWGKIVDVEVEGLGGLETETHRDSVQNAWPYPSSVEYYRKDD